MTVTVRLIGTSPNGDNVKFRLERRSTSQGTGALEVVFRYLQEHLTILGLRYGMSGNGVITLRAEDSQLQSSVVADIRRVCEAALRQV